VKIRLDIEYDGRDFHGWQTQNNVKTIQKHIEDSIMLFLNSWIKKSGGNHAPFTQYMVRLSASGRTDAGVSARAQVASFDWPDGVEFPGSRFITSINGITDPAVSVRNAEVVDDGFDARKKVVSKVYSYCISFRHAPPAIDRERILHVPRCRSTYEELDKICACFTGTHDFTSYRSSDCSSASSVRTIIGIDVLSKKDDKYMIYFHGKGFLKHMIRFMMGDIIRCCTQQLEINDILRMLGEKKRNIAPWCVSPYPLTLEQVFYE
jgi:tRNA pseudouridine38-40 synthase